MTSRRNTTAIANIADIRMRHAIALTTDALILAGLELGLPELFEHFNDGKDEGPYFPLSLLLERAKANMDAEGGWDEESHKLQLHYAEGEDLKLPVEFWWGEWLDTVPSATPIPQEVLSQLVGLVAQAGMTIMYQGHSYMILSLVFGSETRPIGRMSPEMVYEVESIAVVPAHCIVFDVSPEPPPTHEDE